MSNFELKLKSQDHIREIQNTSVEEIKVSFTFVTGTTSAEPAHIVMKIPNQLTQATFENTDNGKDITYFDDSKSLLESLEF
jgi:hypothetical protein